MGAAYIARLLRELADEIDRHGAEALPAVTGEKRRRRRVHDYKPKHAVTPEDIRVMRQHKARRGIPT